MHLLHHALVRIELVVVVDITNAVRERLRPAHNLRPFHRADPAHPVAHDLRWVLTAVRVDIVERVRIGIVEIMLRECGNGCPRRVTGVVLMQILLPARVQELNIVIAGPWPMRHGQIMKWRLVVTGIRGMAHAVPSPFVVGAGVAIMLGGIVTAAVGTVRLTSVDNPVPGNQEFCFAHLQTIVGQVKKIRSPTWGIV